MCANKNMELESGASEADRILYVINDAPFFISHRLPVALEARRRGYDVHIAAPRDVKAKALLEASGLTYHEIEISRKGTSLWREAKTFAAVVSLLRSVRPLLVHGITIKPVLYAGLAARLVGIPALVSAISGLGYVFIAQTLRMRLLRAFAIQAYRLALGHPNARTIFQNPSDAQLFIDQHAVLPARIVLIRGSGVDLDAYKPTPEPDGGLVVTMASRLLWDKGVVEFVQAAVMLAESDSTLTFQLVGDVDEGNPSSVSAALLAEWAQLPCLRVLGQRTDIASIFSGSNVVVLPSYREGLPKVLLEAAACGRAVVTTDVPGCRDAIIDGVTGVLVPVRDARALAAAIDGLLSSHERRMGMGHAGRSLAEREFSIREVVSQHMGVYEELLRTKK